MSQVKQAAERLRRLAAGEDAYDIQRKDAPQRYEADLKTVANAFLAEHLPDDDEAIDAHWLNINYESEHNYVMNVSTYTISARHDLIARQWSDTDIRVCLYGYFQPHITTRGQLRQILRALGA